MDNEFAWDFFESTGNIESYLLYKEYNNMRVEKENNEHNTDSITGA
ncbi:MAG: YqzL family protein [Clostridia bacterium]|nr:YqzL family protein [Clostridia bacterium]